MRHAFLIVAHNEYYILGKLISLIDHPDNDIFIHYDLKSEDTPTYKTNYSKISYIPKQQRINVSWGGLSVTACALRLINAALSAGTKYDYLHLLSGVDLPIKSNQYIHDFFEKNNGKEFVGFNSNDNANKLLYNRLNYLHLFEISTRQKHLALDVLHTALLRFQETTHLHRHLNISDFKKGCNWFSITNALATQLNIDRDKILRKYRFTFCSDEIFMQTFIHNHPEHMQNIYNMDSEYIGCMREIDWDRGQPYVWGESPSDLEILDNSDKLFARKFSSKHQWIVDSIYNKYHDINMDYAQKSLTAQ